MQNDGDVCNSIIHCSSDCEGAAMRVQLYHLTVSGQATIPFDHRNPCVALCSAEEDTILHPGLRANFKVTVDRQNGHDTIETKYAGERSDFSTSCHIQFNMVLSFHYWSLTPSAPKTRNLSGASRCYFPNWVINVAIRGNDTAEGPWMRESATQTAGC